MAVHFNRSIAKNPIGIGSFVVRMFTDEIVRPIAYVVYGVSYILIAWKYSELFDQILRKFVRNRMQWT